MANQLNFPDPITSTVDQRPNRVARIDLNLMRKRNRQVLFGTTVNDKVELWIYQPTGELAAHTNLGPSDEALSLSTVVDNSETVELLNIDLKDVGNRLDLEPGRYVMVANFFRDEVGSEEGYKLYISEISDDRMELRLEPVTFSDQARKDIYEFIAPSVPRTYANALISEIFGQAINQPENETINENNVGQALGVVDRFNYSGTYEIYRNLLITVRERTYRKALDLMAADVFNYYVQSLEIRKYISDALDSVLSAMVAAGEIDPQFELI
jgi:hypothetical protein